MTDELESYDRGSYIESFVLESPKFYASFVCRKDARIKFVRYNVKFIITLIMNFNSIRKLIIERERQEQEKEEKEETAEIEL